MWLLTTAAVADVYKNGAVPCYSCGRVQTDPAKGASPWAVAVVDSEQILVCPDCQARAGWDAPLRQCPSCGSTRLRMMMGSIVCRACGYQGEAST